MKVVTSNEMREIDSITINEIGVPSSVLMERAGLAVVKIIKDLSIENKKIIVIAGNGNNGGDGIVVARNLKNDGWDVKTFIFSEPEKLKEDTFKQYKIAINYGIKFENIKNFLNQSSVLKKEYNLLVDAIFGTGLSKDITDIYKDTIELINKSNFKVISIDIPSGISSDNGQILGTAIKADYTITFGLPKRGHFLYPGFLNTGILFIENIGFPEYLLTSDNLKVELLEKNYIRSIIPERLKYSHKNTYGHAFIIAGSEGKTGACLMSAKACLKSGAGLVTIGIPESLKYIYQSRVTEEMTYILPDKGDGTLSYKAIDRIIKFIEEKADLIAIGPGLGISNDITKIVKKIIRMSKKPIIIDADAINSLKEHIDIFYEKKADIIITPHPGEMMRLSNIESKELIEKNRIEFAQSFSTKYNIYLILKGVPTIIATPEGHVYINPTGNPGMATAGTGDVLTGIISGLLAQNKSPLNSCLLGVYIHGLAGDIASKVIGEIPLTATDIINYIPNAIKHIIQDV